MDKEHIFLFKTDRKKKNTRQQQQQQKNGVGAQRGLSHLHDGRIFRADSFGLHVHFKISMYPTSIRMH